MSPRRRRLVVVRQVRRWLQPPRTRSERAAAVGTAVLLLLTARDLAGTVARAAAGVWWLLPLGVGAATAGWAARAWRKAAAGRANAARLTRLRYTLAQLDAMDPTAFECAVRDLMIRDGIDTRHVGQRGDQAADAIGRDRATGAVVVAQCKHTTVGGKVGSQVMYQVKGTAGPVHGAQHAFVVTNGGLTADARRWGRRHQVGWLDREALRRWAEDGVPVQQLLSWPGRRLGSTRLREVS